MMRKLSRKALRARLRAILRARLRVLLRAILRALALPALLACAGCLSGPAGPDLPLLEMVVIEAGVFLMGSMDGPADERPVHEVEISRSFAMGAVPVSLALWDLFCAGTGRPQLLPDVRERSRYPVARASWFEAIAFCNWLSEQDGRTPCYRKGYGSCDFGANGYRLPTEAEWEFAARGGNLSRGTLYAGSDDPDRVAWYGSGDPGSAAAGPGVPRVRPAGLKQPNELGLYDMSGNCWEWCWDWYNPDYYSVSPARDPRGPGGSARIYGERIRRGGRLGEAVEHSRVANRSADGPEQKANGFRVVFTLP
jgi:sulfatase modifying factor 1